MDQSSREYVQGKLENEGIENALIYYSEFKDYKDEKFHKLRQAFIDLHQEIVTYMELDYS